MASRSAYEKVFDKPELHEMILLHLPLRDLLRAQQVCNSWRDTVQSSSKILKALFFKPYNKGREAKLHWGVSRNASLGWFDRGGKRIADKLLINPFFHDFMYEDSWFEVNEGAMDEEELLDSGKSRYRIRIHDFILVDGPDSSSEAYAKAQKREYEHASWREMLFTQQAIDKFGYWCAKKQDFIWIKNAEGVRLGDIEDKLADHYEECGNCPMFDFHCEVERWDWDGQWEVDLVGSTHTSGHDMLLAIGEEMYYEMY